MREVNFKIKVCGHAIEASAQLPEEPVRPTDLLPILHNLSDAIVEAAASGHPVTCHKGCDACCIQAVPIGEAEAMHLRGVVENMPPETRMAVEKRFVQAVNRLRAAGLFDELNSNLPVDSLEWHALALRYFALNLPCPFLEAQICTIHHDRPFTCREYLATTDPAHCARLLEGSVATVPMPQSLFAVLSRFGDGTQSPSATAFPLTLLLERTLPLHTPTPAPELFERIFRAIVSAPAQPT